jgi:hypothetical protein
VQIRHHHATGFARGAGATFVVQDLDDQALGVHVVQVAVGALQGDDSDFLRAVRVDDGHAQHRLAAGAQSRVQGFADGAHLHELLRSLARAFEVVDEAREVRGVCEQVLRLLFE